jgi:hypothetical protein
MFAATAKNVDRLGLRTRRRARITIERLSKSCAPRETIDPRAGHKPSPRLLPNFQSTLIFSRTTPLMCRPS